MLCGGADESGVYGRSGRWVSVTVPPSGEGNPCGPPATAPSPQVLQSDNNGPVEMAHRLASQVPSG